MSEASEEEVEKYRRGEASYGSKGFGTASEETIKEVAGIEVELAYRHCSMCHYEVIAQRAGAVNCPECGIDMPPIAGAGSIKIKNSPIPTALKDPSESEQRDEPIQTYR